MEDMETPCPMYLGAFLCLCCFAVLQGVRQSSNLVVINLFGVSEFFSITELRPFHVPTPFFFVLDLLYLNFSSFSLHLPSTSPPLYPTLSFPNIYSNPMGPFELQDVMWYLLCLYLIGRFYIQTSELDMHRQTLDFGTFFILTTKSDF